MGTVHDDGSAELWYGQYRNKKPDKPNADLIRKSKITGATVIVNVQLFGVLATQIPERPLRLQMPRNFCLNDIIAELEQQYDACLFADAKRKPHELASCCRAFLDGYAIEKHDQSLAFDQDSMNLELILLLAYEGG